MFSLPLLAANCAAVASAASATPKNLPENFQYDILCVTSTYRTSGKGTDFATPRVQWYYRHTPIDTAKAAETSTLANILADTPEKLRGWASPGNYYNGNIGVAPVAKKQILEVENDENMSTLGKYKKMSEAWNRCYYDRLNLPRNLPHSDTCLDGAGDSQEVINAKRLEKEKFYDDLTKAVENNIGNVVSTKLLLPNQELTMEHTGHEILFKDHGAKIGETDVKNVIFRAVFQTKPKSAEAAASETSKETEKDQPKAMPMVFHENVKYYDVLCVTSARGGWRGWKKPETTQWFYRHTPTEDQQRGEESVLASLLDDTKVGLDRQKNPLAIFAHSVAKTKIMEFEDEADMVVLGKYKKLPEDFKMPTPDPESNIVQGQKVDPKKVETQRKFYGDVAAAIEQGLKEKVFPESLKTSTYDAPEGQIERTHVKNMIYRQVWKTQAPPSVAPDAAATVAPVERVPSAGSAKGGAVDNAPISAQEHEFAADVVAGECGRECSPGNTPADNAVSAVDEDPVAAVKVDGEAHTEVPAEAHTEVPAEAHTEVPAEAAPALVRTPSQMLAATQELDLTVTTPGAAAATTDSDGTSDPDQESPSGLTAGKIALIVLIAVLIAAALAGAVYGVLLYTTNFFDAEAPDYKGVGEESDVTDESGDEDEK